METEEINENTPEKVKSEKKTSANYDNTSFSFSYRYVFTNEETRFEPILVGTACVILSILILPIVSLAGYTRKLISYSARGEPQCPRFKHFRELLKEGSIFLGLIIALVVFASLVDVVLNLLFSRGNIYNMVFSIGILYLFPSIIVTFSVGKFSNPREFVEETLRFAFSFSYLFGFFVFIMAQFAFIVVFFFVTVFTLTIGLIFLLTLYIFACATFWGHRYYVWNNRRGDK